MFFELQRIFFYQYVVSGMYFFQTVLLVFVLNPFGSLEQDIGEDFYRDTFPYVRNTINSPLLTHNFASKSSLMRTYVPLFTDAYLRPNLKLTHNLAPKSCTQKLTNFSPTIFVEHLFRWRYGSKWRAYELKLNLLNVNDVLYCP